MLVVVTGPGAALLIDAASYGLSALMLAQVAAGAGTQAAARERQRFVRDLRDGFAEVRSRTWVWATLLVFSLLNMIASAFPVLGALVANTLWETTLLGHVPDRARSRVSSYDWFGSLALQPVGYALVGPLASAIGTSSTLFACGAMEFALLASLLTVRQVRTLGPATRPT